jgi:4-alpha-glucanotransferase
VLALHAYLAATPARLVGVSLADAVGERRSQNLPGTSDAYPNWRVPLADGRGTPVLLDDVMADPGVRELAEVLRAAGKPVA